VTGDEPAFAVIDVPPGWIVVQGLLVRRTSGSEFTTRTATETLYHALIGADGFALAEPPVELPPDVIQAAVQRLEAVQRERASGPALPPPPRPANANGKTSLPAVRKRR
jgi:hypothetical protein